MATSAERKPSNWKSFDEGLRRGIVLGAAVLAAGIVIVLGAALLSACASANPSVPLISALVLVTMLLLQLVASWAFPRNTRLADLMMAAIATFGRGATRERRGTPAIIAESSVHHSQSNE